MVWGLGVRALGVSGFSFRVSGLGPRVEGLGGSAWSGVKVLKGFVWHGYLEVHGTSRGGQWTQSENETRR